MMRPVLLGAAVLALAGDAAAETSWQTPPAAQRPWQALTAAHGRWRAVWDLDRGVPRRVYGEGIAVPGANGSALLAEAAARRLLAEQLALLAPGAAVDEWELVANVVHGRGGTMRSVGFVQRHAGMRVLGGQVGFLFKADRMIVMSSDAVPHVRIAAPARLAPDGEVARAAIATIAQAYGGAPAAAAPGEVSILPTDRGLRTVRAVTVELAAPRGRWDVYVDAATAEPVAHVSTLHTGTGQLRYLAPVRHPGGGRMAYPAAHAAVRILAQDATADATGAVTFNGASAQVSAFATGPRVRVAEFGAGGVATTDLGLVDGGTATWDASATPLVEAQLSAFIHAGIVKTFAVTELDPTLPWLAGPLDVVVNEPGSCNAYSNGDSIHFLAASAECENSALIVDWIYHEFGHSLHNQTFIPGIGANEPHLSEGVSDYLAATITGDPNLGRGYRFASGTEPERELDPADGEAFFPDDLDMDPHISGLIIGGALWDLRTGLIAAHGAEAGKRLADDLYYAILKRSNGMETAYVEVLGADDDNGNLDDGTPNKCAIDRAFAPHGLTDPTLTDGLATPSRDGFEVRISMAPPPGACADAAVASATLTWHTGGDAQDLAMSAGGGFLAATIPTQPEGTDVHYTITVTTEGGGRYEFPQNAADPEYHFHVAPLVPVYCTDFERDPFADGWTHAAVGGSSEWRWGVPVSAPRVGDPGVAFSGENVVGMDLGPPGGNGYYASSRVQTLTAPAVGLGGRTGARLQFRRWLSVEDGFYDDAKIFADGVELWRNAVGGENDDLHHRDREWRFHDLDLAAHAADDTVQISFRLEPDGTLELGGWNLDDFCIMARPLPGEVCGDGALLGQESCDDGNQVSGDGCSATCEIELDPEDGGCCSTGGGSPAGPIGLGVLSAALLLRRRRYTVSVTPRRPFPHR